MISRCAFRWWSLLLVVAFAGFLPLGSRAASPERSAGRIVAAQVHGPVTTMAADGVSRPLRDGDEIAEDGTVTTPPGASAVLVFSNGATVAVGSDSALRVREFVQEGFTETYRVAGATEEPSTSVTRLRLIRGELVGNVKHLRLDRGSSFTVETAVGAAGIRGTVFRIVVRADSAGKAVFSLSTDQGEVVLQGLDRSGVSVPAGREVRLSFEASVDAATGELTLTTPVAIQAGTDPISADNQAAIQDAQQQIVEAVQTVTASPSGGASSSQQKPASGGESTGDDLLKLPLLPPTSNDHSTD